MSIEVKIPNVGESITSANVARWHKQDGEAVAKGDVVLTIETDKVSNDLEAAADGILKILVQEGEEVDIGSVVATIEEGAAEQQIQEPRFKNQEVDMAVDSVVATTVAAQLSTPAASAKVIEIKVPAAGESITSANVGHWHVENGASVSKGDILVTLETDKVSNELEPDLSVTPSTSARAGQPVVENGGRTTRKKMSMLRRKIASHLVNAQQTAAILTTFNEVDMTAIMEMRKSVQDGFVAKHGCKLGFMSFFVKATVQALKDIPAVNGRIDGDHVIQNHFYDIGVAIGTEKGLVVPVVRDCDQKSFAEIEQGILAYAMKAQEGKMELSDLQGGVFTISNGGVYGSLLSTPILNSPQSGILGMHTIQQRPVAINGEVVIRPMMNLALSYDHRLVDGKEAVTFLIRIKDCLENPSRLMLEM